MKRISDAIPKKLLEEAAFMLLSSSSIDRYIRTAKSLSFNSDLKKSLSSVDDDDLMSDADSLWREILQADNRDLPEIKLAILLPLVAELASDKASDILSSIAMQDRLPATWISALSRHLYNHRATSVEFRRITISYWIRSFDTKSVKNRGPIRMLSSSPVEDTIPNRMPPEVSEKVNYA